MKYPHIRKAFSEEEFSRIREAEIGTGRGLTASEIAEDLGRPVEDEEDYFDVYDKLLSAFSFTAYVEQTSDVGKIEEFLAKDERQEKERIKRVMSALGKRSAKVRKTNYSELAQKRWSKGPSS